MLTGPQGGEIPAYELIDEYCSVGNHSQRGKIPIKHIVDRTLRTIDFMIEKVEGNMPSHQSTWAHMLYVVECMAPTIFN